MSSNTTATTRVMFYTTPLPLLQIPPPPPLTPL
jgi:hypothetical protein